jgi:nitrogen regulatory protein PII
MQMHDKKRIEIIIEAPILHRLTDLLDRSDVSGYTVIPALAGKGRGGTWSREGQATEAGAMTMVIVVTSEHRVPGLLDEIYKLLARRIGIVTLSDVQVIRKDHF